MINNHLSPKFVHLPEVFSSAVTIQLILINRASEVIFSETSYSSATYSRGRKLEMIQFPTTRNVAVTVKPELKGKLNKGNPVDSVVLKMRNRS